MERQNPSRAKESTQYDVTNEQSQRTSLKSRETQNATNQMDIVPTELQHTENIADDGLIITEDIRRPPNRYAEHA